MAIKVQQPGTTSGLRGKGYSVPVGSLDKWRAARAASAVTRCEVLGFGDSLIWGQGPAAGAYSFLQRLRERAASAGFVDGGRGLNAQYNQTTDNYGSEPAPISAQTGFALTSAGGLVLMPGALVSNTANDSITFKSVGTKARLWFSRYTLGGRFSYTVNGGAAVTVGGGVELPPIPPASGGISSIDCLYLTSGDGFTSGTNTIVVTNLGGNPLQAPIPFASGAFSSGGVIPAGTYYYKVTTTPSGSTESLPGAAIGPITVASGQKVFLQIAAQGGGYTNSFYRSTTLGGTYGLVGTQATSGSATEFDDNTASPGGQNPPTSSTALDPTNKYVAVSIEALQDAGIVWQNHGQQGQATAATFEAHTTSDYNNMAVAAMGVQWGTGSNGLNLSTASELLPSAANSGFDTPLNRAAARKPSLVIIAYGTNDIQQASGGADTLTAPTVTDGGVGIGSGLAGATYYYKVQRVVDKQFGGGPLSAATAGTAITATHQAIITAPIIGSGNYVGVPVYNVYRSTTSGGTYGFVGQIIGASGQLIDNVATPGAAPSATANYAPIADTSATENALGIAIRIARNANADVLVVLPSIESLNNSRTLGATFKSAIRNVAEAFSCAWVDWDVALGPYALRAGLGYGGGNSNPHLLKPAYQAQGDFLWNNVLSV